VRRVVLDDAIIAVCAIRIIIVALFERQNGGEAVATGEGVADQAGAIAASENHVIVDDIAEIAREGNEGRFIETDAETAKLDIGKTQRTGGTFNTIAPIITGFGKGLQSAKIGFRRRGEAQCEASLVIPGIAARIDATVTINETATVDIVTASSVVTDIAGYAKAGFGARNIEISRTIGVANANILNRFRLRCHNGIRSICSSGCNQCCSRTEQQALDLHFIASRNFSDEA